MKCLTLLALLVLATLAYVEANKGSIRRKCIDCNEQPLHHAAVEAQKDGNVNINKLFTTTTITPSKPSPPPQGHRGRTTAKPRSKNDKLSGLSLQQTVVGGKKAGKVSINQLYTTITPRKPSPPQGHDGRIPAKPRSKNDDLQQTVGKAQKAGEVGIKGKCIYCNELFTTTSTTPRKTSPPQGPHKKTTAKPRSKTSSAPKRIRLE